MSHLHIPDGILPLWLWLLGYILTVVFFLIAINYVKKNNLSHKIPLISIMTALMLLSMSIPIPFPVPYHLNIAVLSGIILGPVLAFFAVFTTNLLLAFTSHGGITVIGLNTAIITAEAILGYFIFKFLYKKTGKIFLAASMAAFCALLISTFLNIGIVYAGTHNLGSLAHYQCCSLSEHHHEGNFNIKKFFSVMLIFGSVGWIIESFVTGFIVNYINKVKPDLLNL